MKEETSAINGGKGRILKTVPSPPPLSSLSSKNNLPESPLSLSSSSSLSSASSSSTSSNGCNGGTIGVAQEEECRTSILIKKQMNEIDKEIHRRMQNRNIKKVQFCNFKLKFETFLKDKFYSLKSFQF